MRYIGFLQKVFKMWDDVKSKASHQIVSKRECFDFTELIISVKLYLRDFFEFHFPQNKDSQVE